MNKSILEWHHVDEETKPDAGEVCLLSLVTEDFFIATYISGGEWWDSEGGVWNAERVFEWSPLHQRDYRVDDGSVDATLECLGIAMRQKAEFQSAADEASAEKSALESRLKRFSEETGLTKFSGAGLSVSIADKMRAKYDPARWNELFAWCNETGNQHIIQRRITDAKVDELVDGGVALPEGLTLESYKNVSIRRV